MPREDNALAMSDNASLSLWLSSQMRRAGFKSANATVQSAMASVAEDILRFLFKTDCLHVFGSYSDGWGSSLRELDGSIEAYSDIDLTLVSATQPFQLRSDAAGEPDLRTFDMVEYLDGHICITSNSAGPNFSVKNSSAGVFSALDVIIALPCLSYPYIELLQPGYKNRQGQPTNISPDIMAKLRDEVLGKSSRCHAVAASPPDVPPGSRMRVSTTLLERSVMQNLTTVQGQFFIFIKFLIKKVINEKVSGPKTYMAKNLLFYMLDETAVADWKPENLLELVRRSLQMLVEMMESSDSDDVCMKHFFLRDANVYFKKDHEPKPIIVQVVRAVCLELHVEIGRFEDSLTEYQVSGVQFHALFSLLLLAEMHACSEVPELAMLAYRAVRDAHAAVAELFTGTTADEHLKILLDKIGDIPDCVKVSRDWLRALAHLRVGKSLDKTSTPLEFCISRGIPCPSECEEMPFDEAKASVLEMLLELEPMRLKVEQGKILSCALEKELSSAASFIASLRNGTVQRSEALLGLLLQSSPILPRVMNYRNIEINRTRSHMTSVNRHLRSVIGSGAGGGLPSSTSCSSRSDSDDKQKQLTEDEVD